MFNVSLLDMHSLSFFRYKFFLCIITISVLFLTFLSLPYIGSGNKVMYIIFTIVSFIMLILGMLQDKSISVLIFTILIFVGFWLKHTFHLIFKYEYLEPIGNFHFSTNQINELYLISSLGILGIILAIFLITFFSKYKYNKLPTVNIGNKTNIFIFLSIIAIFVLSLILNNTFMFLKLGAISIDSQLPWIVKVFSLWSMGVLIPILLYVLIFNYIDNFKMFFFIYLVILILAFYLSISINSRMVLLSWVFPLLLGVLFNRFFDSKKRLLLFVLFLLTLFLSVKVVNNNRYSNNVIKTEEQTVNRTVLSFSRLLVDRWIGVEGLMSVISYENKSLSSFLTLASEFRQKGQLDFFTKEIALKSDSPDIILNAAKSNFASLPGIIAFLYITGNVIFVFFGLVVTVIVLYLVESSTYKISKNILLVYLFSFYFSYSFTAIGVDLLRSLRYMSSYFIAIVLIYALLNLINLKEGEKH